MTRTDRSSVRVRVAGLTAAAVLMLAACSGTGYGAGGATQPSVPPAAGSASESPASAASSPTATVYQVAIAQDATLGPHLVGEDGKSLYLLTKDSANTTTCAGACAANWPPFELDPSESVAPGTGVTGTLATVTRADDGKPQVTYNGIPLYYFAGDAKAGDTNGQGKLGVWFLVAPGSTAGAGPITGGVGQSTTAGSPATAAPSQGGSHDYNYGGSASSAPASTPRPSTATPRPSASAAPAGPTSAPVEIRNFAFDPVSLTVSVGSSVTWTNDDGATHTVTADDGSFDSGRLGTGGTFTKTFAKAGTFTYHCAIHVSMTATITVAP